jgi:hypothetical protein
MDHCESDKLVLYVLASGIVVYSVNSLNKTVQELFFNNPKTASWSQPDGSLYYNLQTFPVESNNVYSLFSEEFGDLESLCTNDNGVESIFKF